MPLPLELDKKLLAGKRIAIGLLNLFNPAAGALADFTDQVSEAAGRLTTKQQSTATGQAIMFVKNATLATLAGVAAGALIVGAGAAIAGLASLGTVGALTASMLVAGGIGFSVTQIVSVVTNTSNFIVNFDVNQTDEQLDELLKSKIESFYGTLGETVGSSLGYLVCGALPGAVAFAFNPTVGAAILQDIDDEARDEILGQVNSIARTAFQTIINAELANKFKSSRRFLKKNPDNPFTKAVKDLMGAENFKKWGDSHNSSWTIHQDIVEKRIEAIKDKGKREFFEEALEGFGDSCLESGYIVANNIDSQLAAQALMRQKLLGRQTEVKISFD